MNAVLRNQLTEGELKVLLYYQLKFDRKIILDEHKLKKEHVRSKFSFPTLLCIVLMICHTLSS